MGGGGIKEEGDGEGEDGGEKGEGEGVEEEGKEGGEGDVEGDWENGDGKRGGHSFALSPLSKVKYDLSEF